MDISFEIKTLTACFEYAAKELSAEPHAVDRMVDTAATIYERGIDFLGVRSLPLVLDWSTAPQMKLNIFTIVCEHMPKGYTDKPEKLAEEIYKTAKNKHLLHINRY